MRILPFDPTTASGHEWEAVLVLERQNAAEFNPDDTPLVLEQLRARWLNEPSFTQTWRWLAWDDAGETVWARAFLRSYTTAENQHLADMWVYVAPERRRQGLGGAMLPPIVDGAQAVDRSLLRTWTQSIVPAGEAFMRVVGAHKALETSENVLDMTDLDLMRSWVQRAQERAAGYRLEFVEGWFPEADLPDIAAVVGSLNDAPRGELQVEDDVHTADTVRAWEASILGRGDNIWSMFAREPQAERVVGWTEVVIDPHNPHRLYQGGTGVLREHRNLGLGCWLKAAMALKVAEQLPHVRSIRTGNADANAPMLSINTRMGFRAAIAEAVWQMSVDQAERHQAAQGVSRYGASWGTLPLQTAGR